MGGRNLRDSLLNWALVATIAVAGSVAIATVLAGTRASQTISTEAQRSILIADMHSAIQAESEAAAEFVAHLPDPMATGEMAGLDSEDDGMDSDAAGVDSENASMDSNDDGAVGSIHSEDDPAGLGEHPDVLVAAQSFQDAANEALILSDTTGGARDIRLAIASHSRYIEALTRLNDVAHGEENAMHLYHNDTQGVENSARESVQRLRESTMQSLSAAVERTKNIGRLQVVALPVAAIGALIASIWLTQTRRSRHRIRVLEELISEKDRFIGTVSHELRTPLAAIVGFADLLSSDEAQLSERERREFLSTITRGGIEVSAIVEDLLVAARAEIGELSMVTVPVNLAAQTRQVMESVEFPGSTTPRVVDREVVVLGDPGRIRQIIRNLLTNAERHGGPDIYLDIGEEGDEAILKVLDNGEPVPESERDRMFQPYTTLAHDRPVTGSIGLGLAVSRQLATLMGGSLEYHHEQGYSVFTLRLPGASVREQPKVDKMHSMSISVSGS